MLRVAGVSAVAVAGAPPNAPARVARPLEVGRVDAGGRLERELQYELRIDLEGMQGRGIAGAVGALGPDVADSPTMVSSEGHVEARILRPLGDIIASPIDATFALVGELMLLLRPDFATSSVLLQQLRERIKSDGQHGPKMRFLKFAEPLVR